MAKNNAPFSSARVGSRKLFAAVLCTGFLALAAEEPKNLTLQVRDYLTMPDPGKLEYATDSKGELFVISKSDGMIREVVGAVERSPL